MVYFNIKIPLAEEVIKLLTMMLNCGITETNDQMWAYSS